MRQSFVLAVLLALGSGHAFSEETAPKSAAAALTLSGQPLGPNQPGGELMHYLRLVQSRVRQNVSNIDGLKRRKFSIELKVWLNQAGSVTGVDVLRGTGDGDLDSLIQQTLIAMPAFPELPPAMPPSVLVRLGNIR